MKTVTLPNQRVVFETNIRVVLTKFDLVTVASLALARGKSIDSRNQLIRLTKGMIEKHGISGLLRVSKRYRDLGAATKLVDLLFPELISKPLSMTCVRCSAN